MEIIAVEDYWDQLVKSRSSPFVGLLFRVPPRLWRTLSIVQSELRKEDRRQVYAKPSTFHITIKGLGFIGERFNEERLDPLLLRISKLISEFKPFSIRFKGLGMFPTSIHVKVDDPSDQLRMINKRISKELDSEIEQSEFDGEKYLPHVTLATFATKDADDLIKRVTSSEMREFEFGECSVLEVEVVAANMFLALGPEELQDRAFEYLRSFPLGESKHARPLN